MPPQAVTYFTGLLASQRDAARKEKTKKSKENPPKKSKK
jgi:hypothetical protein